jgi:hypothetical protein
LYQATSWTSYGWNTCMGAIGWARR